MKHPITGRPLTIVAAALAMVPTGFFLAALITGAGVNIISSTITLAMWWSGVALAWLYDSAQQQTRTERKEN